MAPTFRIFVRTAEGSEFQAFTWCRDGHLASPALGARAANLVTTWPLSGRRRSDD